MAKDAHRSCSGESTIVRAQQEIQQALASYAANDFDTAEMHFLKACEIAPEYPQAHYNLGYFLYDQEAREASIIALKRARELQQPYPQATYMIACNYLELDQLEAAERWFKQAAEEAPDDPNIHLNRGIILARQGRLKEAIVCFGACSQHENRDRAAFHEALCLQELGQWDEALALFRHLIMRDPAWRPIIIKSMSKGATGRLTLSVNQLRKWLMPTGRSYSRSASRK